MPEKAGIIKTLVPPGPEYDIVINSEGEITIKGTIDFERATAETISHQGHSHYKSSVAGVTHFLPFTTMIKLKHPI